MQPETSLLRSFKPAVELLREHTEQGETVRIVTHNDADGIASGGILSMVMTRLDAPFKTSSEKRLDGKVLEAVASERNPIILFSDFGSGYLELIKEHLQGSDIIILDHHLPSDVEVSNLIHVNPILHGIDGSREVASSGLCYLFAKEVDEGNLDLSPLGLLGALGDQQDKGEKSSLYGLNTLIEGDAIKGGFLEKRVDLIFYGYETRPIPRAIAYTTTPFIPGLSGREDTCVAFLNEVGIQAKNNGRWRALRDLDEDEKRALFSALSSHMVSEGCDAEAVHSLIGTIYTFTGEEPWTPLRDGREYSSLLNACGRMSRPGLGLSITLGDRGAAMEEAEETVAEYRRKIGVALDWVRTEGKIMELDNIYLLRAEDRIDDAVIGVVSSILLSQGILKSEKPIIASARSEEGLIKVSGRSTEALVARGLHLGKVMQEAAESVEGGGGGHDIAAGAYLPQDKETEFIERIDRLVPGQFTG